MKDNVYNSYLAGIDILLQIYNSVLCMADDFKPITNCQNYSGGSQKDKAGVAFVSPVELREKKSSGMSKSPQIEAVAGVQKRDDGTMPPNEASHSNFFHCGSNHHWARDCGQLIKTQRQLM